MCTVNNTQLQYSLLPIDEHTSHPIQTQIAGTYYPQH